jgi:anthranilate/para-aminobenzoate synthase component I
MSGDKDLLSWSYAIFKNLPDWLQQPCEYAYIMHIPALNQARIGLCPRQTIIYNSGQIINCEQHRTETVPSSDQHALEQLRDILHPERSYFCMASLDLHRKFKDHDLPLLLFVQPGIEIHVSDEHPDHVKIVAEDISIQEKLHTAIQYLSIQQEAAVGTKMTCSQKLHTITDDWQGETDESFLSRIREAVNILQTMPSKMILTRCYHKKFLSTLSPLLLYRIYTLLEPNCAASHYIRLPHGVVSIGCSPENIFEVRNNNLSVDVLSATRPVASDPEKDARFSQELLTDPKEQSEHEISIEHYLLQLKSLCIPESIEMVRKKDIRLLRNVRHLYSVISGRLQDSQTFFDILHSCYPSLNAFLPELIPLADRMEAPTRFYGGMVGYLSADRKEMRCFQNLRSTLLKASTIFMYAGVGVMPASRPEFELLEVKNKLQCLVDAIALWENE